MKRFFLSIFVTFFSLSVHSQTTLSLQQCQQMALENNIKTQTAQLEIQSAQETQKAAFTSFFPSISSSFIGFYADNYLIDSKTMGSQSVNFSINSSLFEEALELLESYISFCPLFDPSNFDFSIQMIKKGLLGNVMLMQPLYAGGRIVNGNKLAKLGVTSATYQYQMAEKEVMLAVETYYWNIISLQEKLIMLQQSENLLDTIYYQVEGTVQNDLALQNDKMKVKLKRDELRLNRKKLENGMNISKQLLCQFIGMDNHENIILLDTLNTNEITLPNMSIAPNITSLPEYKLLDLNVQAQKYQLKMTLGESMPQIAVGAAYLHYNLDKSPNNNMALVASLSIPISDWWKTSHNYKKQKINLEVAEKTRQDVAQKLDLQTQQFINEITEAYEEMRYWEKAIEESTENYRIVNDYYLCSMNTISDLLEAQTTLQSTKNQYIESCINYKIKSLKYLQLFSN